MTKKELLIVKKVYNCLKRGKLKFQTGLCLFASDMCDLNKFKVGEYSLFIDWLYKNRPKDSIGHIYWWEMGDRTPRLQFLKKELDKKLKKN